MGINPTQPNHKAFTFDGTSSRGYGVYITGEAVFNAPQRDVQMVDIPGRNGAYALDKGNFNNITVKYPASIVADNATDFAKAVSDLRNFLCSKTGYCRLEDEYNPDEYRMAIYKSGLEVSHDMLTAGEFDITFECKPQRWLTSGEELITIGEWGETETASGEIATFEADSATAIKTLTADIEPIQDTSGGDPSPTNICPISGRNSIDFVRTGKNLLNLDTTGIVPSQASYSNGVISIVNKAFTSNTAYRIGTFTVPKTDSYIFSGSVDGSASTYQLRIYNSGGTSVIERSIDGDSAPVSLTKGTTYSVYAFMYNGYTASGLKFYPMLRFATETDDTWEKYNGTTYTTALGTTVYGGTLDVVSGSLTNKYQYETKTEFNSKSGNTAVDQYLITGLTTAKSNANVVCNMAPKGSIFDGSITSPVCGFANDTLGAFRFSFPKSMGIDTLAKANAVISNGITFAYEKATPTTTQLTAQQVQTLLGTNNIFADSGDVTVEYGQNPMVLVNPTLFPSRPMLETIGYGSIDIGGQIVTVDNVPIGIIKIASSSTGTSSSLTQTLDVSNMNASDTIEISNAHFEASYRKGKPEFEVTQLSIVSVPSGVSITRSGDNNARSVIITPDTVSFAKGTSGTWSKTVGISVTVWNGVSPSTSGVNITCTLTYDGDSTLSYSMSFSALVSGAIRNRIITSSDVFGDSTISALGNPTYIDMDIGEAYNLDSGTPVSVNNAVTLPAELPTLPSGNTTITFDNTFTKVDIVPRWWKV